MTSYLLDTTCLIHLARRTPLAVDAIARLLTESHVLGCCAIPVAEFYSGLPRVRAPGMDGFIDLLQYWPIGHGDAVQAGGYRYTYARKGLQLSVSDTLIAAVARRVTATVITENLKDFPMDDIRTVSLAQV